MIERLPYTAGTVRLRELQRADLDDFFDYRSLADVAALQGWAPMARSEAHAFLRRHAQGARLIPGVWRQLGIANAHDDRLIGDVGVCLAPGGASAEFGITVHPARQGKGVGTAAVRALLFLLFTYTPAQRVVAVTDARNPACIRALEKAGMDRAETRAATFKGEPCTEYLYTALRPPG